MNQAGETIAQLQGASKRYGDVLALDQVDLDVRRGEVQALLGPNGAGKTTAISLLLGLLRPDTGTAAEIVIRRGWRPRREASSLHKESTLGRVDKPIDARIAN